MSFLLPILGFIQDWLEKGGGGGDGATATVG